MRVAKTLAGSLLALSVLAPSALPSAAQNWPTRPVKILLPLGPGSGADIGARLIAEKLAAKWSQPVVVENRPGGDGFVAINAFVSARDDHTLFFAPAASFTSHPYLHEKLPYDPRDLAPVARVSATVVSLTAPPQLNIKSLGELMAMARAQPGKLNWASVAIVRGAIDAGRIKLLAITSSAPSAIVPGVMTATQAGFPGLTFDGLVGFYGTRDMPSELREKIATDVRA